MTHLEQAASSHVSKLSINYAISQCCKHIHIYGIWCIAMKTCMYIYLYIMVCAKSHNNCHHEYRVLLTLIALFATLIAYKRSNIEWH